MKIISHRGYWKAQPEKNNWAAFERSFSLGFGTETDLRDYCERIVIAHDMANSSSINLERVFELYCKYELNEPLALNIKADGLHNLLKSLLEKYAISNYFVFDMSIPDTLGYINNGIQFFSRQSEYEPQPSFYEHCTGIWLDAFVGTWYNHELIFDHINKKKKVAIVSSELHKREHLPLWEKLKKENIHLVEDVILCTDLPQDASEYFR